MCCHILIGNTQYRGVRNIRGSVSSDLTGRAQSRARQRHQGRQMRTVALAKLLSSMQPGTALMGICFTPRSIHAAVTTCHVRQEYPTDVPQAATADPDSLFKVVKELQVGGLILGGSALFRTNGLTQFGARHLVSRVGGDAFSNMGETAEAAQLPIALWTKSGDDPARMIADFLQA